MEHYVSNGDAIIWTTIHKHIDENKPYLCLCGGGPGLGDTLYDVDRLLSHRFNVIRFEQRGCGRSTVDGNYDLETTISDLVKIQEYYKLDKWIIGGHSWGANLSLIFALTYPDRCDGVLYISGSGVQNDQDWNDEFRSNADKLEGPEFTLPDGISINYDVLNTGLRSFNKYLKRPSLYRDISKLKIPTIVLYGEDDIRPAWAAIQLANLLPNCTLELVSNAGHIIWNDEPNRFRESIFTWLDDKLI